MLFYFMFIAVHTCKWLKLTNQWSSQYSYLFKSGKFMKNIDRLYCEG